MYKYNTIIFDIDTFLSLYENKLINESQDFAMDIEDLANHDKAPMFVKNLASL